MRLRTTGFRVGMVAAATAGTILLTGAGVAPVPKSSNAVGQVVNFCFSKKAAATTDGGALLSYFTPGVNRRQCATGQKFLALDLGDAPLSGMIGTFADGASASRPPTG